MERDEALRLLRGGEGGIGEWNRRRDDGEEIPSLGRANLSELDLRGANLSQADLHGTNLSDANLHGVSLIGSNLSGADLSGVDLTDASLMFARIRGANLSRAHLSGAKCGFTLFDCDLSETDDLDAIIHVGPSVVGMRAVRGFDGRPFPEAFFHGCGFSELIVDAFKAEQGAIQFYSCFISYSSKDDAFATRLHSDLMQTNVTCWFAPEDMKGGDYLHDQVGGAIMLHDKLLLVLSEDSMASKWVATEIRRAIRKEDGFGKRCLFPVRLVDIETIKAWELPDPDTGEDLALRVRAYHVPDFSNWKNHDDYSKSLERLVEDLRVEK